MLPKIYMSRMDVEEAYLDKFGAWCKCRHWPDLVNVGFHSANGYLSEVGGPRSCNVYEIPGVEVFSPEYAQIREVDEELKIIVTEKISNHSLTVYDQVATQGIPDSDGRSGPSLAQSWSCPAMSALRFEVPETRDDEVVALHRHDVFGSLAQQPSFLRARLLREAEKHPTYPSPEPRWALLVEWADLDAAVAHEAAAAAAVEGHFGADASRVLFNAARHVFSLRNASGWRP